MIKNKRLFRTWIIFAVIFYAVWALTEMVMMPLIGSVTDNRYILTVFRDVLIKNLFWTLPAILLIRHFSEDMYSGIKELFSFNKKTWKYLLLLIPISAVVIGGQLIRNHSLSVSSSFHPSMIFMVLFVGLTEEIVFRGFFLNSMMKNADTEKKRYLAFAVNAVMFLVIHFPIWIAEGRFVSSFSSFGFVTVLFLSVLFGICFVRTKSLWSAIIIHSLYDLLICVIV